MRSVSLELISILGTTILKILLFFLIMEVKRYRRDYKTQF